MAGWMRAVLALGVSLICALPVRAEAESAAGSTDVRSVVQWVFATRDHGGRAFAVVDKKAATLHVFDRGGKLVGHTSVLLGAAKGDHSVPGIGDKPTHLIRPHERTTPAGRFDSEPGRNLDGEHVVWFDYDAGLAIHRLRPGLSQVPRRQRLASGAADDNRVSLGCIVVPEAFYDEVVRPVLGSRRGVVYVLPETVPVQSLVARWLNG